MYDHVYDHDHYLLVEFDHILAPSSTAASLLHSPHCDLLQYYIIKIELSWQTEDSQKIGLREIE